MGTIFEEFSNGRPVSKAPFIRIPFKEAMLKYGSDKPDLRNPLIIQDATALFGNSGFSVYDSKVQAGEQIRAIVAPNAGDKPRSFFDKFDAFENCIVGKTDERYTILNKNGTSDVDINYKDLLIDYNYYIVYGVVNDNDECAFISVDDFKKITIFGSYYFKNSGTDRYDPRLFKRNDKYYILAYKNDEEYCYHPYIISDEKTICVNELLNSEVLRLVDRTDSSIGFETDEEVYDEKNGFYYHAKSWISPDGEIICKKDTNYETESCTNGYLVTNEHHFIFGGKKYIKDSSGKEIAVADEIKKDLHSFPTRRSSDLIAKME